MNTLTHVGNLFAFIGGLGMFLYGMDIMASGLQKTAGNKMKDLLGYLTNNRILGVLVGALVTAIIQSSSATTVMVVGFVNAGIMNLTQAAGVIMGANVGTTITAWLVSANEWAGALKPDFFAPFILGIGAFIITFSNKQKMTQKAEIAVGFGILFIGLSSMSSSIGVYQELSVTAAVTGGIDSNGMCPGDPSSYYERNGAYEMLPPGTINVFIYINQNVTEAAMVRSMMIASEAKAAAVSHLLLGSCYSEEIATGSGTDGMVIASAMEGELTLTDASGHSKLGELIGRAVRMAVKHALMKQTAACGPRQFQVLVRTGRYGITPGTLWDFYTEHEILFHAYNISFKKASELEGILLSRNRNSNLVLCVSLYLHLMDQLRWGLIMEPEAVREGKRLLLYGLYCGRDTYLGDVYPEDVWKNEVLKTFSLKEQLIYILICYFSVRS